MAEGDIGAVIDTLTFDAVRGNAPCMVHVGGDVYAIAFEGPDSDGWLVTVSINAAGAISDAVIDSLEFDEVNCASADIIHIAGDVFAIVYAGETFHGYIKTVSIDAAGNIGNAVIDTLEYDTVSGQYPSIALVYGDVYAIALSGEALDGFIKTVSINAAGAISDAVIDSYEFDTVGCYTSRLLKVAGNTFAIVYTDNSLDGWVKTITIADDGTITKAIIDSLEFNGSQGRYPDIKHVAGDIFAIVHCGPLNDGYIVTVSINAAGAVSDTVVDSWIFEPGAAYYPKILHVSGNVFAVSYRDVAGDGMLVTLTVADDGTITEAWIDSLEFDPADCTFSLFVHVGGNVYAIAYAGTGAVGKLVTTGIETIPLGKIHHLMMMGID